ncbi:MAG: rnr, partial [Hyphomicrobiales bacterium]|nr:rnr [Hyphomicrobiales bacterium]
MPKKTPRPHEPATRAALPSREDILAFIAREREAAGGAPLKIGKREVARAFGIKGSDRIGLKALLKDLESDGSVERRGKHLHKSGMLPPVVLADIKARDRDGDLIATPVEWDVDAQGPIPKIYVRVPRKARPGQPAPGLGDRALLRTELSPEGTHDA